MARSIWTGSIGFGLVNVPVGLYSATEDHTVHFSQFEKDTPNRIRYRRVNEETGEEVDYADIVKGFDLGGGDYVIVTPEELEEVEPGRSRTIEITDFVDGSEIDPIFYRNTYYLAPSGEAAERPYGLLLAAMGRANRVAIASLVMRGKQYLAAIRARGEVLVLETMYFADEVRDPAKELDSLPAAQKFQERELDMAGTLIESMTVPWEPERYADEYHDRVMELIEAKRRGEAVVTEGGKETPGAVVDLMQALERSLATARGRAPASRSDDGDGETDDLGSLSKDALYEKAQKKKVPGRSKMSRSELEEALRRAS